MDKQNRLIFGFSLLCLAFVWIMSLTSKSNKALSYEILRNPAQAKEVTLTRKTVQVADYSQILEIKNCYQSQDCPFDQSDPRAYDLAVGKKLAEELNQAHQKNKKDPKLEVIARELMKSEDGFVQEAALDILKEFPNGSENLESVAEGLTDSSNPLIVELSLPYLEQFLGSSNEPRVHQLLNSLLTGAHLVSQSVSENILKFINTESYPYYLKKLSQMNPQTKAYQNLKSALKEFELQQSGG